MLFPRAKNIDGTTTYSNVTNLRGNHLQPRPTLIHSGRFQRLNPAKSADLRQLLATMRSSVPKRRADPA
jgi:hypothetical protein